MSCLFSSSCNINSCNKGLSPICIPYVQFQPNVIECPNIEFTPVESPLCDLLPTITSLPDFLINLPFLMLYVVSLPARFLYCMAYEFLANVDEFLDIIIYYLIYPGIDFATLPFLYFVLGFNNGLIGNFSLPTEPYGFLNGCFLGNVLEDAYIILGDLFYIIGFANGFFSSLLVRILNLLIDIPCYLAFFTLTINLGFCLTFCVPVVNWCLPPASACVSVSVEPFCILQNFICEFLNCACALGSCPGVTLNLTLNLGCCPSCPQNNSPIPQCIQYNLNPVQPVNQTFTTPNITFNTGKPPQQTSPSESVPPQSEQTTSESETTSSQNKQSTSESESIPSEITSESETSEYQISEIIPPSEYNPCSVVSELYYCQECLSKHVNCNLCADVLNTIKQYNCTFPCCNYPCLISNACYQCSECSECSEQYHENACIICDTVLSHCYANQSYVNLPCYSEFVYLLRECFTTYNSEICSEAESEYNYCKIIKAKSLCPPTITSESEVCEISSIY